MPLSEYEFWGYSTAPETAAELAARMSETDEDANAGSVPDSLEIKA